MTTQRRWRSDVNSFPGLDGQTSFGLSYVYEYNTLATYGKDISGWSLNDELNATWWYFVTEREIASVPPRLAPLSSDTVLILVFRDGSIFESCDGTDVLFLISPIC